MNTETETPSEYGSDTTTVKRVARLRELVKVITRGRIADGEFSMRIPADEDRDADLVLSWAARKIESLSAPVGDVGDAAKELQNVVIPRLVLNEDTVSAKHVRQAISALEAQAREIAKLKRRVPVAKHNALQEEATGLLAAVKTYQTKIAEQQKRIADSDEVKG